MASGKIRSWLVQLPSDQSTSRIRHHRRPLSRIMGEGRLPIPHPSAVRLPPMLPSQLGPYKIERKIGRGGMGTVYLGADERGTMAAIKLLAADMAKHGDFRDRFEGEIETLRKLKHPNIVQIIGFGEQDDQLYYSMEYVAGSSLEEQLARGRVFTWREVAQIGIEVSRALRHAHDRGVIHRDIKPGNLLLTDEGQTKLSDFGIARLFGNVRLTSVGSVLGTAEFMAPEQAEGRPVDPRSDLYSLGGLLYVLLARRPLFHAKTFIEMIEKQRFERPTAIQKVAVDVPDEFAQIIHKLLEKDPNQRYATATVLERRLETMMQSLVMPLEGETHATEGSEPADDSDAASKPPIDHLGATKAVTIGVDPIPSIEARRMEALLPETRAAPTPATTSATSPPKTTGRFVAVTPGELDSPAQDTPTNIISHQTAALVIGLLATGLLAWYFLQPISADALFRRIESQTGSQTDEALLSAEDDIRLFEMRYSNDARWDTFREYSDRLDLLHLERKLELQAKGLGSRTALTPVERTYLDTHNLARIDPEAALAKFQAMIDLFGAAKEHTTPTWQCIQLVKRRLAELRQQCEAQSREQLTMIVERLDRADELRTTDAKRAAKIYNAVIELYKSKPWADAVVERAGKSLRQKGSE